MNSVLRTRSNNSLLVRKICGISVLVALVFVLQVIANYTPSVGGVSFNFALVPLVLASILYGVSGGAITGFVLGIVIILSPSTLSVFMPINAWATVFLCLIKTSVAGALAGLVFQLLYKKFFKTACFAAAIITPIVNTGIFAAGCALFFGNLLTSGGQDAGQTPVQYLFLTFIGVNFILEFCLNLVLGPSICMIVKTLVKEDKIGSNLAYFNKKKEAAKVEIVDDNKPTDVEEVVQQIENPEVKQLDNTQEVQAIENKSETPDVLDNTTTEKVEVENTSENTETNNTEETK